MFQLMPHSLVVWSAAAKCMFCVVASCTEMCLESAHIQVILGQLSTDLTDHEVWLRYGAQHETKLNMTLCRADDRIASMQADAD